MTLNCNDNYDFNNMNNINSVYNDVNSYVYFTLCLFDN